MPGPGTHDAAPRFRDMADRRGARHEALLAQQAVLAEFGEFALRADDLDLILNEACRLVGRALGTDLAKVMERQADGRTLLVRAGVGWEPGLVGRLTTSTEEDTSTAHALATGEPCIVPDLARERRFKVAGFVTDHGVRALVNVPVRGVDGKPPYGILEVDSREPRRFTGTDTDFLRTYANLLAEPIERIRVLRELRVGKSFFQGSTELRILEDLKLNLNGGEIVAVIGESGSGKSTLLSLLAGFESPDRGDIYYESATTTWGVMPSGPHSESARWVSFFRTII